MRIQKYLEHTGEDKKSQREQLSNLLKSFQERLEYLESKENMDDFLKGQIHELTISIIHIQNAYLNCL